MTPICGCTVMGIEAQCKCKTQWTNKDCGEPKCGTGNSFFDINKDECRCPATSEKCCSRDVVAKAALLDQMVATRRQLMLSGDEAHEKTMTKMLDHAEVMSLAE